VVELLLVHTRYTEGPARRVYAWRRPIRPGPHPSTPQEKLAEFTRRRSPPGHRADRLSLRPDDHRRAERIGTHPCRGSFSFGPTGERAPGRRLVSALSVLPLQHRDDQLRDSKPRPGPSERVAVPRLRICRGRSRRRGPTAATADPADQPRLWAPIAGTPNLFACRRELLPRTVRARVDMPEPPPCRVMFIKPRPRSPAPPTRSFRPTETTQTRLRSRAAIVIVARPAAGSRPARTRSTLPGTDRQRTSGPRPMEGKAGSSASPVPLKIMRAKALPGHLPPQRPHGLVTADEAGSLRETSGSDLGQRRGPRRTHTNGKPTPTSQIIEGLRATTTLQDGDIITTAHPRRRGHGHGRAPMARPRPTPSASRDRGSEP